MIICVRCKKGNLREHVLTEVPGISTVCPLLITCRGHSMCIFYVKDVGFQYHLIFIILIGLKI